MGLMRKPEVIRLSSREDYASFVSKFDTFLIDCDGIPYVIQKLTQGFYGPATQFSPESEKQ